MKKIPAFKGVIQKKLATAVLVMASLAAFGTLGDGGKKGSQQRLLSSKPAAYNFNSFSLKSGYQYRGSSVLSNGSGNKYIMVNTVVTYQKGNNTYILPLKRKVLLDKVNSHTFRY